MTPSLHDLPFTIPALAQAYADGLKPAAVLHEVLRRLKAVDDPSIFLHLADEEALVREAEALGAHDPTRPLWGIPFAAKDNIDVAGMPTTAACPAFIYHPDDDAFVIARLREAGAIPVGKTNLDQFATGLVGVRSPYGIPKNALDPEIVPGGSSSGSAVSVAHGIVPFALGTDTAGSGRVPAALNGIVGLKPSLGAFSATGVVPACRTLDTISVFALTVPDAHTVFRAATAFDEDDAYARTIPSGPMPAPLPKPRVTAPDPASLIFFGDRVQREDFEAALADLEGQGAEITRADFTPFYDVAEMLYDGAWVAERYAAIEDMMVNQPEEVHPVTRAIIGKAEELSAADAFKGFYRLEELKRACVPILEAADMLCVPTIPTFYSCADLEADPVTPNSNLGTYTNFVNLLNLCGIAVPTGQRGDGRPGSVTFLAETGQDGQIAAQAAQLMGSRAPKLGATGLDANAVDLAPSNAEQALGEDEIALAVCGAHMSGLPLNRELISRGARLIGPARTARAYSLYALPGGLPHRPGLVRSGKSGQAIELEVWALPQQAMGSFMAGVPAPLVIGSVELEDGQTVKGFLCENSGLQDAENISAHGGWRAYLKAQELLPELVD